MPLPTQNSCLTTILDGFVRQGNTIISVSGQVPNYTVTMRTPTGAIVAQVVTVLNPVCNTRDPSGVVLN